MTKSLFAVALICLLVGCSAPQEPSLHSISNVEIVTLSRDAIEITADMVLTNPNPFSLDLAKADLQAMVDEVVLADIDQTYDAVMPADTLFAMPIAVKMDLKKLYGDNPLAAIGQAMQIMSDRHLDVRFVGTIDAGKGAVKMAIPIDQVEPVKF